MKKTVSFFILLFAVNYLVAQEVETGKLPNEQSRVNKEYDENGNLICFDSTYVKSWSSDSTMNLIDFESIQKEMKDLLGSNFNGFFSDSISSGNDPFRDLQKEFLEHRQSFMNGFSFGNDSNNWDGFLPDNLDSLHNEMMKNFGRFFKTDTLKFENESNPTDFEFFFSPEEMEKIRKELEEQFDQPVEQKEEVKRNGNSLVR
ncbi:hypothetical protein ACUNWD_19115 [Sunxiuqinia sp. A32]|uniref:hypothetical protein n=1 Tax=Sunxiuqinia sp. A32 TaxID=3461496 RepID=UPI0040463BB3